MRAALFSALLSLLLLPDGANASEAQFLKSLGGQWTGTGMVLSKIGGRKVNVSCNIKSDASETALSMNGNCRGFVVVSRAFSADMKVSGQRYAGNYIGPSGQPSRLVGSRGGNAINLAVTWARVVNGDRNANMMIEKVGENGLRLQTVDRDPASGKSVVTSRIDLKRQ